MTNSQPTQVTLLKLRESDEKLEDERKKWEEEKNSSKATTEMLQQSSEAALYKLQGERQQISQVS